MVLILVMDGQVLRKGAKSRCLAAQENVPKRRSTSTWYSSVPYMVGFVE